MLAAIRPGDWELSLLVHVAGAMLLVGSLVTVLVIGLASRRGGADTAALGRLAYRVLLFGVLPSWVVMRVGAQWVERESPFDGDAGWIGLGYATSEAGLLVILVAIFLARRALRRTGTGPAGGARAVVALSGVLLVAYTVTIWVMTTKPG